MAAFQSRGNMVGPPDIPTLGTINWSKIQPHITSLQHSLHLTQLPTLNMNYSNKFQSRVRPAFSRGKTIMLATDPERHLQLERERLEVQERRQRPKSPLLIPIEVKPLSKTLEMNSYDKKHKQKTLRLRDVANKQTNQENIINWWKKTPEPNGVLRRNLPVMSTNQSQDHWMPSKATQLQSRRYLPHSETSPVSQSLSEVEPRAKQRRNKKPLRGYGSYSISPQSQREASFILQAKQWKGVGGDLTKTISKVHEMNKHDLCCRSDNSSDRSHLPFISTGHPQKSYCDSFSDSISLSSITMPSEKKTLVVQLPNINCTPATPFPAAIESNKQPVTSAKAAKLKQLKQREITELFSDIKELNQYNTALVQSLEQSKEEYTETYETISDVVSDDESAYYDDVFS